MITTGIRILFLKELNIIKYTPPLLLFETYKDLFLNLNEIISRQQEQICNVTVALYTLFYVFYNEFTHI